MEHSCVLQGAIKKPVLSKLVRRQVEFKSQQDFFVDVHIPQVIYKGSLKERRLGHVGRERYTEQQAAWKT